MINDILVKPAGDVVRGSDTVSLIEARPGGSAATQAAWLGWLGVDVTFAGRCGARDVSYHRAELERFGVRTWLVADPEADTGSIVIMVSPDGERTMFTDRGANLRLRRSDLPVDLLDDAAVLHLTGYTFFEPALREVARSGLMALAKLPRTAALHGSPWIPGPRLSSPGWGRGTSPPGQQQPCARAFLRRPRRGPVRLFAPAHRRTIEIGRASREGARYDLVVLKLGGDGCVVAARDSAPVLVAGAFHAGRPVAAELAARSARRSR